MSLERSQYCITRVFRSRRKAGTGEREQTQLAAFPSTPCIWAHQNCSDSTKPVLVTCPSPGFRNNTLRTAQLAGKIFSASAKILFALDWLPTVFERGEVFQMPKIDCKLCHGTLPSESQQDRGFLLEKRAHLGFCAGGCKKMYWSAQTERGIIRLRNIASVLSKETGKWAWKSMETVPVQISFLFERWLYIYLHLINLLNLNPRGLYTKAVYRLLGWNLYHNFNYYYVK